MLSFGFSSLIVNRFVLAAARESISIPERRWKIQSSWFSFVYFIYLPESANIVYGNTASCEITDFHSYFKEINGLCYYNKVLT